MNIYAGNLPWGLSEEDLREAFEAFGEVVSVKIIQDKFTGRSRGFGFVEMPNNEEGEAAISALNGKDLKGREIVVNQARPRRDDQGGGGGGGF
jgi:RNA recognition motif-containing protein